MKEIKYKAWDELDKVMLTINDFSSYNGCDSSDGKKNRHDKRCIMTWAGHSFQDGILQRFIMLQYVGLKTSQGRIEEIYESDLLKYKDKLWKVEYVEENAGYMLVRTLDEFGENKKIRLSEKVAFDSDILGNYYLNPEVLRTAKNRFLMDKKKEK